MKKYKEISLNNGKNNIIKVNKKIANGYNLLLKFLNANFLSINDMDMNHEFKKEFKQHLYYNIYQNPSGFVSLIKEINILQNLVSTLGDFGLYYNKDEYY